LGKKKNARKYFGNPDRIFIGGSSAGGNLAAVVAIMAREDNMFQPKPVAQILHAPCVDFYLSSRSMAEFTATPLWNSAMMLYARHLYIPNMEDWGDYRSSPLYADSHKDLPPAFIIVNRFLLVFLITQTFQFVPTFEYLILITPKKSP